MLINISGFSLVSFFLVSVSGLGCPGPSASCRLCWLLVASMLCASAHFSWSLQLTRSEKQCVVDVPSTPAGGYLLLSRLISFSSIPSSQRDWYMLCVELGVCPRWSKELDQTRALPLRFLLSMHLCQTWKNYQDTCTCDHHHRQRRGRKTRAARVVTVSCRTGTRPRPLRALAAGHVSIKQFDVMS